MTEGAWVLHRHCLAEIKAAEAFLGEASRLLSARRGAFSKAVARSDRSKTALRSTPGSGEALWKVWRHKADRARALGELVEEATAIRDTQHRRVNETKKAFLDSMGLIQALQDVESLVSGRKTGRRIQVCHVHAVGWMLGNLEELEQKTRDAVNAAREELQEAKVATALAGSLLEQARGRLRTAVTRPTAGRTAWEAKMTAIKRASTASRKVQIKLRLEELRALKAEEDLGGAAHLLALVIALKKAVEDVEHITLEALGSLVYGDEHRRRDSAV